MSRHIVGEAVPIDFVAAFYRGGTSNGVRGTAVDALRATGKGRDASRWVRRYGLHLSTTFAFVRYSDSESSALALEWCGRMQFLFDHWRAQASWNYVFTLAGAQSHGEHPDCVALGAPTAPTHE